MGVWLKAPIVLGTLSMIASHYLGQSWDEFFGLGAVMSTFGLLALTELVGPDRVQAAISKERKRCEAEFERRQLKKQRFERGEITFGELCDPLFP